jgi:DNA-binding PadR family transcriptional regulator
MKNEHLGEFEALILAALLRLEPDAYGVSIRREIEQCTERNVSIGAVYTTLNRLEKKHMVRSVLGTPTASRGGRAKRYYQARPEGRLALERTVAALNRMTEGLMPL